MFQSKGSYSVNIHECLIKYMYVVSTKSNQSVWNLAPYIFHKLCVYLQYRTCVCIKLVD